MAASPRVVTLDFTETLNRRLTGASLVSVANGTTASSVSSISGRRMTVRPTVRLPRGAYRLDWHSVSTDDGHALEGSFSFGVRASAGSSEHSVDQSPLARDGWVRVLARALMYAGLLVFAGALLLPALLSRTGGSWLAPSGMATVEDGEVARVVERERALVNDFGFVAAGAAAFSAIADAADAASGISVGGLHDYLLGSRAGEARVAVVILVLIAGSVAVRRPRAAAVPAALALGAVALSGHASSADPRWLSVGVDWLHLVAAAVWLGGIALIVAVWGPALRGGGSVRRLAVARDVLPVFGRVALPAFGLVVLTGAASAVIELGSLSALWQTDYGRVLLFKMGLVAFVAAASYVHALRLRPRLLAAGTSMDERLERRHWRLLRTEPLLGVGVVVAVALLVAFPLPPRQLRADDEARAATPACNPCPLPKPAAEELAVAEQGGSDVVAAWVRRERGGLTGQVRLYGLNQEPATDSFAITGAVQSTCGVGCRRFRTPIVSPELSVAVRQRGRTYVARLSTQWRRRDGALARRLLVRAQARMRALRSVRESERVQSVPGLFARTVYRLKAPNRFAYRTNGDVQSIAIDKTQWDRPEPRLPWRKGEFGGGLSFRTASWFTWTTYAENVYLLAFRREAGRRLAVVGTMDPGTPAWWRLYIDLRSSRIIRSRLITAGHFMDQRFFAFNRPIRIEPPVRGRRGR